MSSSGFLARFHRSLPSQPRIGPGNLATVSKKAALGSSDVVGQDPPRGDAELAGSVLRATVRDFSLIPTGVRMAHARRCSEKSRLERVREWFVRGISQPPRGKHRKTQLTIYSIGAYVKTVVGISAESPQFRAASHGFRPRLGCHTALMEIQRTWRTRRGSSKEILPSASIASIMRCPSQHWGLTSATSASCVWYKVSRPLDRMRKWSED